MKTTLLTLFACYFVSYGANCDTERLSTEQFRKKMQKEIKVAELLQKAETNEEVKRILGITNISSTSNRFYAVGFTGDGEKSASRQDRWVAPKCLLRKEIIPINRNEYDNHVYSPDCVEMNRCSGCCSHRALSCQPTAKETVNVDVLWISSPQGPNTIITVPFEQHLACKCGCQTKKEDCSAKQDYDEASCFCNCNNLDEEEKCREKDRNVLHWDMEFCACLCNSPCPEGSHQNKDTCKCSRIPLANRWTSDGRTTTYDNWQSRPLFHLDATNPRRKPKDDPEY